MMRAGGFFEIAKRVRAEFSAKGKRRNRGFVLMSVIFAATLLLTAATAFAWFARNEAKRAVRELFIYKARCAAQAAAQFTIGDMNLSSLSSASRYETKMPIDGFEVMVTAVPLDDRVSVRGIFLDDGITLRSEYGHCWNEIWRTLGHPELADEVLDFMDADSRTRAGGNEPDNYPNRPILAFSELKLIKGIDDAVLYGSGKKPALADFVSLGGNEMININSVKPELLPLLDSDITPRLAAGLALYRRNKTIASMSELESLPGFPSAAAARLTNIVSFQSEQAELDITVKAENGDTRRFEAVVQKKTGDDETDEEEEAEGNKYEIAEWRE